MSGLQIVKISGPIEVIEAPLTPAQSIERGIPFWIWGYRDSNGVYDEITLSEISSARAAGWPDYAIFINVLGTTRPANDGTTGTFSVPSISIQPVTAAPVLVGISIGLFSLPGLISQPILSALRLSSGTSGQFIIPAASIRPVISGPTLNGSRSGVFSIPAISLQPTISAANLSGTATSSMIEDFESGTLNGWSTGVPAMAVSDVNPIAGTYSARCYIAGGADVYDVYVQKTINIIQGQTVSMKYKYAVGSGEFVPKIIVDGSARTMELTRYNSGSGVASFVSALPSGTHILKIAATLSSSFDGEGYTPTNLECWFDDITIQ